MKKGLIYGVIFLLCFASLWLLLKGQTPSFVSKEAEGYLRELNYVKVRGTPHYLTVYAVSPKMKPDFFIGKVNFIHNGPFDAELDLQAIEWNIAKRLKNTSTEDVFMSLRDYVPYKDMMKKPLETLILAGFPILRGRMNIKVGIAPKTGLPLITVRIEADNAFETQFEIYLKYKDERLVEELLTYLVKGRVMTALERMNMEYFRLISEDKGFAKKYKQYTLHFPSEEMEEFSKGNEYSFLQQKKNERSFTYNPFQ
ncbi:MAG: hypothetical protein J6U64_02945 [Alphaproteobacteria bacterium]|nr:hypothetical protein [Alphaproteobacteria bacterium]